LNVRLAIRLSDHRQAYRPRAQPGEPAWCEPILTLTEEQFQEMRAAGHPSDEMVVELYVCDEHKLRLPDSTADLYDDWWPYTGKDVITLLGDLLDGDPG
jgi:hypothetical protein